MKIKNILISQPKPTATDKSPYTDIAKKYNINVDFNPFVKVERIEYKEFLQSKIDIKSHNAFIFNSKIAIDHFFHTCKEGKIEINNEWRYFCLSDAIAFYLQKHIIFRKRKIFFSEKQTIEDLMYYIKRYSNEKFLLVLSEVHKDDIPKALEKANINYTKAIMFRTVSPDVLDLNVNKYEIFLFFSPPGIQFFKEKFPDFVQGEKIFGTLGANTAKTASELGFRIDIKVPNAEFVSMANALDNFLKIYTNFK